MIPKILKLESLSIFLFTLYIYHQIDYSWALFFLLILTPDLSILGYQINPKIGSYFYNTIHSYATAILTTFTGLHFGIPLLLNYGLILIAHIAIDRALGFGLKYPTNFKSTHLQKL